MAGVPETDDDLIAGRDFIAADNELASIGFLDAAFEDFDQLSNLPEMGPASSFTHGSLKGMRFLVLPPPFNHWLIFYTPTSDGVDIRRVLYGNVNWRQEPERFLRKPALLFIRRLLIFPYSYPLRSASPPGRLFKFLFNPCLSGVIGGYLN